MRRSTQIPALQNTRGKFTRLEDKAEFKGWVVGEREPQFLVTFEDTRDICAGDTFLCELALRGWTYKLLAFATQVSVKKDENLKQTTIVAAMNQVQTVNVQHSKGDERFRVREMTASVWTSESRISSACDVIDISDKGLSVVLPEEMKLETRLFVLVTVGADPIQFDCEVRYSRQDAAGYRVGLLIHHYDRVAHRKWQRYISEINGVATALAA